MQRVRVIRHGVSVHLCGGEVPLVNKRAIPGDNHSVGRGVRSFGKTRSCSADQLRVEPLLRWRGNRPLVRHVSDYFRLPAESVVEIGRQIAI